MPAATEFATEASSFCAPDTPYSTLESRVEPCCRVVLHRFGHV